MRFAVVLLCAAAFPAFAQDPIPEIQRGAVAPQATGVAHTVRGIPEACARLEGEFTGDPAQPYKFSAVRTSPGCQARARLVDAQKVKPDAAGGWIFNDLIRIPSAACPGLQAVVRVWRHPSSAAPPKLDAQGRSRIYLRDAMDKNKNRALPAIAVYAASMELKGKACGG
jgi:hypothetical protein